jgi:hypothetical protein
MQYSKKPFVLVRKVNLKVAARCWKMKCWQRPSSSLAAETMTCKGHEAQDVGRGQMIGLSKNI